MSDYVIFKSNNPTSLYNRYLNGHRGSRNYRKPFPSVRTPYISRVTFRVIPLLVYKRRAIWPKAHGILSEARGQF